MFKRTVSAALLSLMVFAGTAMAQDVTPEGGEAGAIDHSSVVGPAMTMNNSRVILRFAAQVDGRPAACGMTYRDVGAGGTSVSLMDYRFYVSNVRLITDANEEVALDLEQDGEWQYDTVALLDFEDGTAGCGESGNPEMNDKVIGTLPAGSEGVVYTGVAFDLGIPHELNHLDTTTAPAPLNIPAMWWNWQSGYKFARLDLATQETTLPAWLIHLGSTGCGEGMNGAVPPTEPCSNPNIMAVRMDGFNARENFIVADVGSLVSGVDLSANAPEPPGCMSGGDDTDCMALFPAFALALDSGAMAADGAQQFFHIE